MFFSLKFQRNNRKNALVMDPAKGKTGEKGRMSTRCGSEQPHAMTEPIVHSFETSGISQSLRFGECRKQKLDKHKSLWNGREDGGSPFIGKVFPPFLNTSPKVRLWVILFISYRLRIRPPSPPCIRNRARSPRSTKRCRPT